MKLFKTFLIASTLALVVSIGSLVHAQTLVASVNIENARVVSQVANKFTLGFSLTNREGVQSGVRYGVKLVSETPKGQFVVDEYVFDEALTLTAGALVDKEVSYEAPENLDGTYTLFITARNQSGFPFGTAYVGKAVFTPVQKGVSIDRATCKVKVEDEAYTLSQSFSVQPGVAPTLSCEMTNYTGGATTVTPSFVSFKESLYGTPTDSIGASTAPLQFLIGERKTVSVSLPQFSAPGSYYVVTTLSGDKSDVGSVAVRYGVAGVTASIDNLSFDKTSYKKGDLAKISLVWRASLADNSAKAKATPDVALSLSVTNSVGAKCVAPIEQMLSRASAIKNITVPVVANCANPKAVVTLSDKEGTILATRTFLLEGGSFAVSKHLVTGILVAIVLLLVITIVLHFRKKKEMPTPPTMPTMILLPFLVLFSVGLIAPSTAHADTYSYSTPEGDTIVTEVNLDSSSYSPNGQIIVTASIENQNNWVPYNRSYPVRLTANNNSGASVTIIPQTTLAPGFTSTYLNTDFTAPNPAPAASGTYAVNFTTSVDTAVNGLSLTGFSAGQGWIDGVGLPCWEASLTISESSSGLPFSIRFDTYEDDIYTGQQSLEVTTGVSPWIPTHEYYGATQSRALPDGGKYNVENVCVESAPSNVYVNPAWLCN